MPTAYKSYALMSASTLDSAEDGLSESGARVARTLPPNSILQSCIGNLGKIGLVEQQRIVTILDEAFDGIATAKANAEKNLQNARALFENHLQAVFSEQGEGWVEKPLDTVAEIINGYAFKCTDFSPAEGAKSITITNVGVREFVSETDNYLPSSFVAKYPAFSA